MVSRPSPFFVMSALSIAMVIVGAIAFLLGAEFGTGALLLATVFLCTLFWCNTTLRIDRFIQDAHTLVVREHPKVLTLVPTTVAKQVARRQRSHQAQINAYLTGLAKQVDRSSGYCSCCGESHTMLKRYPFDPGFHRRDCGVALGFQEYGNAEICPWGRLFELPTPVLLQRLPSDRLRGLYRFAKNQAEVFGAGSQDYFIAVGREYLLQSAQSQPKEFLHRLGQRVLEEFAIVEGSVQPSTIGSSDSSR